MKSALSLALITLTAIILMASLTSAQTNGKNRRGTNGEYTFSQNDIDNLISGIKSENCGLRRSSVYLAGLYGVKQSAAALRAVLEAEKDPDTKILIALVLFRIDDMHGMEMVKSFCKNEKNPEVKRMFTAIAEEYDFKNAQGSGVTTIK